MITRGSGPAVRTAPGAALADPDAGFAVASDALLACMVAEPAGRSSASVYETGRLVSLAPWAPLHDRRIAWLLARQRADGGWGGPEGYFLVPTLSAVEALLAVLRRGDAGVPTRERLTHAVDRGLCRLRAALTGPAARRPPDLPATDLIVPALLDLIAEHRTLLWRSPDPAVTDDGATLPLPPGVDRRRLDGVRLLLASGRPLPDKLAHALEVGGAAAHRAAGVEPVGPGTVGASPAATAAWLGTPAVEGEPGASYLEGVIRRHAGPVPCAAPITVFERSWVLGTLARAGMPLAVPATLTDSLRTTLGPDGTPTGAGLPADADTTSATLYALARLGHPVDLSCLLRYDTGEHFCTWPGEDGASVTTNAHVLDALGHQVAHAGPAADRWRPTVERLTAWLVDRQAPDGRWTDRWHASPYYATYCAVLALGGYGRSAPARAAVDRAARWILGTQRPDGSWGRWAGTAEETAYAVQALLATGPDPGTPVAEAVVRGVARLSDLEIGDGEPELWHDKDLYRPTLIVRAAVLAARWAARDLVRDAYEGRHPTPAAP